MKLYQLLILFFFFGLTISCSDDDEVAPPDGGEEEEVINEVLLTFTPAEGGGSVTARWFDADGDGAGAPTIDNIELIEGTEYELSITLANTLEGEDITAEIREEADEHQFFFAFTENIFANPTGNGNLDAIGPEAVNYNDADDNGNPIGLSTQWTAGSHSEVTGSFRIVLKHQPDEKTTGSDSNIGGTDIDINFNLDIIEDPNEEEEVINKIALIFTPNGGGDPISATWFDADGDGVGNPTIDDIELTANTSYEMSITLENTLESEDITEEIEEEADEHMFFFEFTTDLFSDPLGNGNFDNRNDDLNYNDEDENGFPLGLSTNWTTGGTSSGDFRIVLKHQPGLKSSTSDATVGGTDVDISFSIAIN